MCQIYGIKGSLYSHILLSPREHTQSHRSLNAFFPMGIYTKLQIFESSFSTNYVNILLSNSVGKKKPTFFPTSAALECSPVTALSTHTGFFIPVQSPLICTLKGLKPPAITIPSVLNALDNTGNTTACPSSTLCYCFSQPLQAKNREGESHLHKKAVLEVRR